jgi:hypothetical protein
MPVELEATADGERETEAIEIRVFLEALYAKHGYDLRGYADASLRRRIQALLARLGLTRISDLQHRALREPEVLALVINYIAVRVIGRFVPTSDRSCARTRCSRSGTPAAPPAKKRTRARSCSPTRACTIERRSTRPI